MPDPRCFTFEEFSRFMSNLRMIWPDKYRDVLCELDSVRARRGREIEQPVESNAYRVDPMEEIKRLEFYQLNKSAELGRLQKQFDRLHENTNKKDGQQSTLYNTWPFSLFYRKRRKRMEADEGQEEERQREDERHNLQQQIKREEESLEQIATRLDRLREMVASPEFSENDFKKRLRRLYDAGAAEAIGYLYNRADSQTKEIFARLFLSDEDAADYSAVDILVRENTDPAKVRGNQGCYIIFTRKGDMDPMLLKFTHQPTAVYYLMHLIDHYNDGTKSERLDLRKNESTFMQLYQKVYSLSDKEILQRFRGLLVRQDRYGDLRAGRLNDLTYDISQRMAEHFRVYDENPNPYIVNAYHHLLMPRGRICFEGSAQTLLAMKFN